jgi:hypothetical protein
MRPRPLPSTSFPVHRSSYQPTLYGLDTDSAVKQPARKVRDVTTRKTAISRFTPQEPQISCLHPYLAPHCQILQCQRRERFVQVHLESRSWRSQVWDFSIIISWSPHKQRIVTASPCVCQLQPTEGYLTSRWLPVQEKSLNPLKQKTVVFWDVMFHCLVARYRYFGGVYCLHLQKYSSSMKMEAASDFEIMVTIHRIK